MEKREKIVLSLISSFFLFGVLFHALEISYPYMIMFTPLVLASFALVIFIPSLIRAFHEGEGLRLLGWALLVYVITFTLEAVGVASGAVFGEYHYGTVLGPMLWNVPVIIGFNWMIIVFGLASLLFAALPSALLAACLVGLGAVVFDYIMEPVAIGLGYWSWDGGSIPLQNYAAWFLIAFIAALLWKTFGLKSTHPFPRVYLGIQFCFFVCIHLFVL